MVRPGDPTRDPSDMTVTVDVDRGAHGGGGDALAPGDRVGEYILRAEIAGGGCGVVYRAEHRVLGRVAALKVLHADLSASAEMTARFVREARAVNRIGHPNIVDIQDIGSLPDGRPYLVMAYLAGVNAGEYVRVHGRLETPALLALFEPLCSALEAAHRAGIVHRDVKASNVVVRAEPTIAQVTLVDFGLAKLLEPSPGGFVTSRGRVLGTPQTMAPEQILGQPVDARTDVYSLGVLLFQMLTGRLPFAAMARELVLEQHLSGTPPRASAHAPVSPAFDEVIACAMAKEPAERFAGAAAFLAGLDDAARESPRRAHASRPAAAVLIRARMRPAPGVGEAPGREPDEPDRRCGDLQAMLEEAEDRLVESGLAVPLATRDTLLGVYVAEPGETARSVAHRVLADACAIAVFLAEHDTAGPDIQFSIWVDTGALERSADSRSTGTHRSLTGELVDPRTFHEPRFDGLVYAPAGLIDDFEHALLAPQSD